MSSIVNDRATASKIVALHSPHSGLQTSLLGKLIADELKTKCVVVKDLADLPAHVTLLLIDCNGQDTTELRKIAHDFQESHKNATAALLNAEYDSAHENLLDWPCIMGLFYNDTDQEQLVRGLKSLLGGDYWVPRRLLHHFLDRNRKTPTKVKLPDVSLTKRERQILKLIKDGATNADISISLEVSEHTVKSHLYNVYRKIGVRNRLEASKWVRDLDDFGSL